MAKAFNYPIHAFRGFAILNIVAIHAFAFVLFYAESSGSRAGAGLMVAGVLNGVLLHDSTLYFTYISGILFSMVLAERGYRRFFRSKFFYVFLPYLFFTVLYSTQVYEGPPGSPAPPRPARRNRVPVSTPAGMSTVSIFSSSMRPRPRHVVHGCSMI